jgi:CBS domain containing-hemolysin-like protein
VEYVVLALTMLALLLVKAFFSGSEIALVSSDKHRLRMLAQKGDKGAALVIRLFNRPESLLATTLIGTNVATMTLSVIGTATAIQLAGSGGDLYAILALTPVMLILGEIVPKSIFQEKADVIAPRVALPLAVLRTVLMPVVIVLGWVARLVTRLVAPEAPAQSPFDMRQRLRMMLKGSEPAADAALLDRERIRRAIRLSDMTVGEAMVPLARVLGAPRHQSLPDIVQTGLQRGHRRIPLYEGNISNITAIALWTVWDELDSDFASRDAEEFMVDPHYVTPIQRLDELLSILLWRTDHMAIAVDEFGTAVGIVTLEDLMGILLGDVIKGVHLGPRDVQGRVNIERLGDDVLRLDASAPLGLVAEILDIDLPEREFHTVAGFVASRLRRIPAVGDAIEEQGYRITVTEGTSRAAGRVQIERID